MGDESEPLQRLRRVAKLVALLLVTLLLVAGLAVLLVVRHYEARLPSVEQLKTGYQPAQVTRVLARDGTLLGSVFTERRTVVPFSAVPSHVKLAFLAAEDATFYEHQGLNYFGMLRALAANLRAGGTRQGASTITQQIVKNLLLSPERTYERKMKETILARRLEQELGKDEILSLYMNHIYLGHGRYGIEEASRYYFAKKSRDLDLAEASLLAGLVAAPERFSPRADPQRALVRRRYVLGQMLEKGFVTRELYTAAMEEPVRLAPSSEEESELAPEAVATARKILEQAVGERAQRGGFTIYTTIDPRLQAAARKAVRDGLAQYATRQKLEPPLSADTRRVWGPPFTGDPKPHKIYVGRVVALDDARGSIDVEVGNLTGRVLLSHEERYNPKHLAPSAFARVGAALRVSLAAVPEGTPGLVPLHLELGPQAALIAIDVRSREVLAWIGNHEAVAGGLDRATRALRQPGSSFKPFVYGYALASRRFTTASVLELPPDPKVKSEQPGPRRLPLRLAIAKSDNAAAEFLLDAVGAPNVVEWSRAVGIESRLEPTPSLALGAYEVTPLEIANAYATFASGGDYEPARMIRRIVGPDGNDVALPAAPPRRRAIAPEEAYLVTSLLRSVVQDGTGKRATSLNRPLAGKTGTTNRAKDAWFVGYSTEIVTSTWVGYDDALPLGFGEAGAATALPIWMNFMKAAHEGRPATEFPRPNGIVTASIDPATGLLAYAGQTDAVEEEFLDGTVPSETAPTAAGVAGDQGIDDEASESAAHPQGKPTAEGAQSVGSEADAGVVSGDAGAGRPQNVDLPPF